MKVKVPKLKVKGLGKKLHSALNYFLVTMMILGIILPLVFAIVSAFSQ